MNSKYNKKQSQRLGVVYIRESTEEQDKGFSPKNQERIILEYAKNNNIKIVKIYKDLITGTSVVKRDDFQKMIKDAEKGEFEIILVYHTSRFARNVKEARKYKEYLREQLKIDVISVTQHFGDWNEPSAFLNEGINELFDAYYSKQLSAWLRDALQQKRIEGYQLGNPPLGYKKKKLGFDKERSRPIYSKNWEVDKQEANIVRKIFKLYATGNYSYADIAVEINKLGIKTKYGNPFTYSSLKNILGNKVYLGYVYSPRKDYPLIRGNHKSIITKKLFDKVQEVINERRGTKGRPIAQHRFYLLQGLVYCYNCYKHIKGKENNVNARMLPKMYCQTFHGQNNEYLTYSCKFRKENKSCKQENVRCKIIDNQVIKYMEGFNLPNDIVQMTLDKLKEMFKQAKESSGDIKKVKFLESKKRKINFQYTNTNELSDDEYLRQLNEINKEFKKYDNIGLVKNNSKTEKEKYLKQTEKFLKNFKRFWFSLDEKEKQRWIQMVIKRIWVKGKKVVGIEPCDEYKVLFSSHIKLLGQPRSDTPAIKVLSRYLCSKNGLKRCSMKRLRQ